MSDRAVLLLAAAVVAGARLGWSAPWWCVAALVLLAAVRRRAVVVVVTGFLVAGALSWWSWQGLEPPPAAPMAGPALLVGDPVDVGGPLRVELRVGRRHVEAWARGGSAAALRHRLAGEQVWVRGTLRPATREARRRLAAQHIAARLTIEEVREWQPGNVASRAANATRRTLDRGARPLDRESRSILLGVLVGDVREQEEELAEAFRASGLSHLLVVSGGNLAFLIAVLGPVLVRLGLRARFAATVSVIGFFGLLTRWEPSILRASVMAALACGAFTLGRPTSRIRLLALAVIVVVLLDPLLVHSLSFRLSVAATAGIALLAAPLSRHLRGPDWLRAALAVTIAAQVGVAPIALPAFGGIPLASLPANVLAIPAAAPLTAWGFIGGLLAGVAGPPFDAWLHMPSLLLARWLAFVARTGAALPLGSVRVPHAVALAALGGVVWTLRSSRWSWRSVRTASTSRREPS
jgi:competence protein ComEC